MNGGLAQLARAPALHAGGQRFESVILHADSTLVLMLSPDGKSVWPFPGPIARRGGMFFEVLGRSAGALQLRGAARK